MENLFINRHEELNALNERYLSSRSEFIILYGRRRVGKTRLIKEFIKGKPAFYFLARKQNFALEFERIKTEFNRKFNTFVEAGNLEEFLSKAAETIDKKLVFAIDEFPFWMMKEEGICSTLQGIWDEKLKQKNIFLILSGSIIGMMESLLSYQNPLYGRRTGQLRLIPLKFTHLTKAFRTCPIENLVKIYSCTGGIPAYLEEFNLNKSAEENIDRLFFKDRLSVLYEDGEIILKDELREYNTYLNILSAINEGFTKISEIATYAKIDITNIPKYIKTLETLGLVEKEFPIIKIERKTGLGTYRLCDLYFRFWLKFIYPYKSEIEMGSLSFSSLKNLFNKYLGPVFEDISKELLIKLNLEGQLPFKFAKVGRQFGKKKAQIPGNCQYEIDIVSLSDDTHEIAFFECKWKDLSEREAKNVLNELMEKSRFVEWNSGKRKEYFGIFGKKIGNKLKLRKEGILAYDLEDFG